VIAVQIKQRNNGQHYATTIAVEQQLYSGGGWSTLRTAELNAQVSGLQTIWNAPEPGRRLKQEPKSTPTDVTPGTTASTMKQVDVVLI